MYLHNEMTRQMVDYHRERLESSMRAAEHDRELLLKLRERLGSFLIVTGERLRGESVREMIPASPPVLMSPHGDCF